MSMVVRTSNIPVVSSHPTVKTYSVAANTLEYSRVFIWSHWRTFSRIPNRERRAEKLYEVFLAKEGEK
jgi:hypothetical protein